MRIVVGGSSGFIGTAMVERLRAAGHEVVRLVRRDPEAKDEVAWRPCVEPLDPAVVDGADAAVNLAGAGGGDHRWNDAYKALLRASRVNSTHALATAIAAAATPPRVLLNSSAVGFYGDTGDREVDESAAPGSGFFPELCQAWEAATKPAEEAGIRVAHLRTGLALGPGGGLLKPIARLLHRPALLPAPKFALRLVLGEFGGEAVRSQRVLPAVLAGSGYRFAHPDLTSALHWSLAR